MAVYQHCCAVKGGALRPVAVSPDLPSTAREFCARAQNVVAANTVGQRGLKSLYEILCDGGYVYVIHTALRQANFFSHAFIFPGREVLNNPDSFLALSRENFKKSEKEALEWDGAYESLIRDPPMTLEQARKLAGAESPEAYRSLICCAYAQMEQHKIPLFVRYDAPKDGVTEADANRQIRALLHCVWSGLPLFLRRRFSAVSSPGFVGQDFSVVLTKSRKPRPGLWNPNGRNEDILTPQAKSRMRRYAYLEYAAELSENAESLSAYYDWLDKKAAECGDASDETLLTLLSQLYRRRPVGVGHNAESAALLRAPVNFSDDELVEWICEAARTRLHAFRGWEMRKCVRAMLTEHMKRKLKFPDNLPESVRNWLDEEARIVREERVFQKCQNLIRDSRRESALTLDKLTELWQGYASNPAEEKSP